VKVWDRDMVIALIERSNEATGRALYSLFERQTESEQAANATTDHNGVGFNGRDAEFLSSIAKRLPNYGYTLTERQLPHVRRKLRKYSRQLLEIIQAKGGTVVFKKPKKPTATPAHELEVVNTVTVGRSEQFGLF
jgi:hypothetical protein